MDNSDRDRYIQLTGYPVHQPLWKVFHQSAGMRAGMLSSLFAAAVVFVTNNPLSLPMLACSIAYPAFGTMIGHALEKQSARISGFKNQIIDICPTANMPLTKPSNLVKAFLMREEARKLGIVLSAALSAGVSGLAITEVAQKKYNDALISSLCTLEISASALATMAASRRRFDKVLKGDYVILDTPPPAPEKAAQKAGAGFGAAAPQPQSI